MPKTRPARPDAGFDRARALAVALLEVERSFGQGAVWRLDADTPPAPVQVIPTGSLALDLALGVGGLPRGRITELYGPETSGKTTLALSVTAQAQRAGGAALFLDAEHALDLAYARRVGVDLGRLHVCQPDHGEQALEIADQLLRSGGLDLLVVDSMAALVPRAELEGEIGDSHCGLHARLMAQALRKLAGVIAKTNTTVIFCTSSATSSASCSATPRGPPAGGRFATTPRSASTPAAWRPSRTASK